MTNHKKTNISLAGSESPELVSQQHGVFALYNSLVLLHFAQKLQSRKALYLPETAPKVVKPLKKKAVRGTFLRQDKVRYINNAPFFSNACVFTRVLGNR